MRRLFWFLSPGRVLLLGALAVVGYLLFSTGTNVLHSYRLASDEASLREEVEAYQLEHDQLVQIRDYLRTDEYVEFMARRVFGLVKPGENLVVVDAPPPVEQPLARQDESWWQRLFGP